MRNDTEKERKALTDTKQSLPSLKKVRLTSCAFMGLGHILYLKNYAMGLFYAAVEVLALINLPGMVKKIGGLITLGEQNLSLPVTQRDHSIFMMIDGILVLAVLLLIAVLYWVSVHSTVEEYKLVLRSGQLPGKERKHSQLIENLFFGVAMSPTLVLIVVFVLVPLIFSFLVAFTDYSSPNHLPPANTVNWVGLDNFKDLFGRDANFTTALIHTSIWTLVWGVLATLTCYFGGLIVAELVNNKHIKLAPIFRTLYILPYAVPANISMIVWRFMFNGSFGTINKTLAALGFNANINWLGDVSLARIVCIIVNLWAGFPYFMLLALGTITSISPDIFEAATIDGCDGFKRFWKITLPLVLRQNTPLIIMGLCKNLNNFGAIFFLTGGNPTTSYSTATSAKGTDILVTWIYSLTIDLLKYNYASALAVLVFLVLAPFAIFNFVNTKSFKEGEL